MGREVFEDSDGACRADGIAGPAMTQFVCLSTLIELSPISPCAAIAGRASNRHPSSTWSLVPAALAFLVGWCSITTMWAGRLLLLPEDLLTTADWNVGDRLLVEVVPYRRLAVTNLGKQPTPWDGLPTRIKKRE